MGSLVTPSALRRTLRGRKESLHGGEHRLRKGQKMNVHLAAHEYMRVR